MAQTPLNAAQHINAGKVRRFPVVAAYRSRSRPDQWSGIARVAIIAGLTVLSWAVILTSVL